MYCVIISIDKDLRGWTFREKGSREWKKLKNLLYFLQLFHEGDQILTLMVTKDITVPNIYVSSEYLDLCNICYWI